LASAGKLGLLDLYPSNQGGNEYSKLTQLFTFRVLDDVAARFGHKQNNTTSFFSAVKFEPTQNADGRLCDQASFICGYSVGIEGGNIAGKANEYSQLWDLNDSLHGHQHHTPSIAGSEAFNAANGSALLWSFSAQFSSAGEGCLRAIATGRRLRRLL
jgi:hypothetical protein